MPKPDQSVVKSAARTLEIFEYFDEARRPAHIQEVALALGYPHSSTAALLRSLADLGYLEFSAEDKTYFPSIRVSLLGHWVSDEVFPLRRIQQQMRDLAEETQMTVVLGAVSGGYCQYVRVIEGTTPIRYHVKAGTRRCLVRSTLGRVLLALEPPDTRTRMIAEALAVWDGDEAPPPAEEITGDLIQVAARGHAFHAGLVHESAAMLAIPLAVGPPARPLALGLAAPKDLFRGRRPELLGIMRDVLGSLGTPGPRAAPKTA
ncbi:MAG: helix-turn-helix domain-containing protein [Phenylobacterium sp.]|jgi:DNA-binding IclR family transcriptional regulator|uniref:IclR family transcriptional regulator n=1 Tax=Caulobacteraceae TaxID=76892 RepID=UPI00273011C5|nr:MULTISPECIES: helix-turn-helix domain-containing protein [Caulobacteraceae]MBW0152382.1 helix-turn-helix domain-containing protein [Phenylobacterium sp.]MDP1875846.1 helix-turn-helix domain-containing protein [Phenylobacterium sp.]MDZ4111769.1 helix-turn-helix domain-containing protein [Brevundimonas sp.]MDZ4370477.1 helix-turn-helix domain-containing protein [Phenylobacterium sp.]